MNCEGVLYKTVEYIPGVGTLYSAARSLVYAGSGDSKEAVISALNLYQGLVRDAVITLGGGEPQNVAILHAIFENTSDELVSLVLGSGDKRSKIEEVVTRKHKELDQDHTFVLVPYEDNHKFHMTLQRNIEKIIKFVKLHGSIYVGVLNWFNYAKDEMITLVVPHGFGIGKPIYAYWQWTEDGAGVRNQQNKRSGTIEEFEHQEDNPSISFYRFKGDYNYWFSGTLYLDSGKLELYMHTRNSTDTKKVELTLDRYIAF